MSSQTEAFFEQFACVVNSGETEQMADFHLLPSVFVTDESKRVCSQRDDVNVLYQELFRAMNALGVTEHQAQLNQAMRLSETVTFANVRWRHLDINGQQVCATNSSYTLQTSECGGPKVIVAVLDDEAKIMSRLLNAA